MQVVQVVYYIPSSLHIHVYVHISLTLKGTCIISCGVKQFSKNISVCILVSIATHPWLSQEVTKDGELLRNVLSLPLHTTTPQTGQGG